MKPRPQELVLIALPMMVEVVAVVMIVGMAMIWLAIRSHA